MYRRYNNFYNIYNFLSMRKKDLYVCKAKGACFFCSVHINQINNFSACTYWENAAESSRNVHAMFFFIVIYDFSSRIPPYTNRFNFPRITFRSVHIIRTRTYTTLFDKLQCSRRKKESCTQYRYKQLC